MLSEEPSDSAVELPRPVRAEDVAAIDLVGPGRGQSIVTAVRRVLTLDEAFQPVIFPITWAGEAVIDEDADRVPVYEAALDPSRPTPAPTASPAAAP